MPPAAHPSDILKSAALQAATNIVLTAVAAGRDVPESMAYAAELAQRFGLEKAIITVAQSLLSEAKEYNW